jgi:hypothetical protein
LDPNPLEKPLVTDTVAAMDALDALLGRGRYILAGICSGADIVPSIAASDTRVAGGILINGYFVGEQHEQEFLREVNDRCLARVYRTRMFSLQRWLRLFTGKSDIRRMWRWMLAAVESRVHRESTQTYAATATTWKSAVAHGAELCFIYSADSSAWDAYQMVHRSAIEQLDSGKVTVVRIGCADHVFSLAGHRDALGNAVQSWLQSTRRAWRRGSFQPLCGNRCGPNTIRFQ